MRLRHKIEKRANEHARKQRKLARKDPTWRTRLKKDPGIPNLFPYKNKILQEIEDKKRDKETANLRQSESESKVDNSTLPVPEDESEDVELEDADDASTDGTDMSDIDDDPMAALAASAAAKAEEYDDSHFNGDGSDDDDDEDYSKIPQQKRDHSRRSYQNVFEQVVDEADVVLYVLDARDPLGTRSADVEQKILDPSGGSLKRLIFILNKADLVPAPILKDWLQYLKHSFPTIAVRASKAAPNTLSLGSTSLSIQATSQKLLSALKAYASLKQLHRPINVAVVGYPNVGKSSIINALLSQLGKSNRACPVGAEAGVTSTLRYVKLDGKTKILDSPGVVFPHAKILDKSKEHARLVLLNAVPPKEITDPIPAVKLILERMSGSEEQSCRIRQIYNLPALYSEKTMDATTEFLIHVARSRGRLLKHGVPDLIGTAKSIINDWCQGRLPQWTVAPLDATVQNKGQKVLVSEWAKEFDLDDM